MSISMRPVNNLSEYKYAERLYAEIEKHIECPITNETVIDPVVADCGHSYEKAKIQEWKNRSSTCPTRGEGACNSIS